MDHESLPMFNGGNDEAMGCQVSADGRVGCPNPRKTMRKDYHRELAMSHWSPFHSPEFQVSSKPLEGSDRQEPRNLQVVSISYKI